MGAAVEQRARLDLVAEARRQWEERWGAAPAPAMAAVTSIMRVQQLLMAELNALLKPLNLTFPRYEALMLLEFSSHGSLPLGKVGERLQVHRTSVTNIVDQLERFGFVRRVPHDADRRAVLAEISPAGRRAAAAATETLHAAEFGLGGTDRDDLESIVAILDGVRERAGDF
ncbi:MAG TPA: MarR family transcriptional regulator [Thermoleophilaceae bacterium]|nr:MarR family transcriptional regulator [Thermoleophilaceae bacterium]